MEWLARMNLGGQWQSQIAIDWASMYLSNLLFSKYKMHERCIVPVYNHACVMRACMKRGAELLMRAKKKDEVIIH